MLMGCTSEPGLAQLETALSSGTTCSSDAAGISRRSSEERAESRAVCPSESPIEGLWLPRGRAFVAQQRNTVPMQDPALLPLSHGDLQPPEDTRARSSAALGCQAVNCLGSGATSKQPRLPAARRRLFGKASTSNLLFTSQIPEMSSISN